MFSVVFLVDCNSLKLDKIHSIKAIERIKIDSTHWNEMNTYFAITFKRGELSAKPLI